MTDYYSDWEDDERAPVMTRHIYKSSKYTNEYDDEDKIIPIYQIMKEYFDEEKDNMYCYPYKKYSDFDYFKNEYYDSYYNYETDLGTYYSEYPSLESLDISSTSSATGGDDDDTTEKTDDDSKPDLEDDCKYYESEIYKKFSYT